MLPSAHTTCSRTSSEGEPSNRTSCGMAPLSMTARGTNAENFLDFGTTMNAMPIVIYQYAGAADERSIGQAWATALVLMVIALALNVLVRWRTVNSRVA